MGIARVASPPIAAAGGAVLTPAYRDRFGQKMHPAIALTAVRRSLRRSPRGHGHGETVSTMTIQTLARHFWLCLAFGLAACTSSGAVPTLIPTVQVPLPATNTPLPRLGAGLPATSTPQGTPAAPVDALIAGANPAATPVAAGIGSTSPIVSIANAARLAQMVAGSDVTVSGLAQRDPSHRVWVSILSLDQRLLLDVPATITSSGGRTDTWEVTFRAPLSTLGRASLLASVRTADNQVLMVDPHPVELVLDATLTDRYITLTEPGSGFTAYTGYYVYLTGQMSRPAGGLITMLVLDEACRAVASRQSFGIRSGSGRWFGYILVPRDAAPGPGCVVATFGEPGDDVWRQTFVPITIGDGDDRDAPTTLHIIEPAADATARAGHSFLVSGLAYNVPGQTIEVNVSLDSGLSLAQSQGAVDDFGYWELDVSLPPGIAGSAAVTIRAGSPGDDGYAEARLLLTIE